MAMRPSSSSSSSSFSNRFRFSYDVFLSFRGEDTRYGFTGNLCNALVGKGIRTFIDDVELERGGEITPTLEKAIEESRIFIIVLSQDYASSSFCLNELAHIHKCKEEKGVLVIPIFHNVEPSDVRYQKGKFGEALANHVKKYETAWEKLNTWKKALNHVANLSGYTFKAPGENYEHKLIKEIVQFVSRKINRTPLHLDDDMVGLESQVLQLKVLLDVGSDDIVHMVGIHGPGGIGKTTLAVAVYNSIAENFEDLCFLKNVRENSKRYGLTHLQSNLLSETVGEVFQITSEEKGRSEIKHRLQNKKVLLIIDDVDDIKQLKAIIGRSDWFGGGSRVIITTRNKQLLACHGVERTYEVKELNEEDALQLLSLKAFKLKSFDPRYQNVLNEAIAYASGLPLALEVIGSNLCGKPIQLWKSALNDYKRFPDKKIQDILKVSYDDLGKEEQRVFLDISCSFKVHILEEVEDILQARYGHCMKNRINVLVDRSLIRICDSILTLHDLIADMGKDIVRNESTEEPGERSRLFGEDIIEVLEDNKGTSKTEILHMDFGDSKEKVEWDGFAFKDMTNLRILTIKGRNDIFSTAPKHLPNSLRVLDWSRYPSKHFPNDFYPKKLVICELPDSKLEFIPECFKDSCSLTSLTLADSRSLQEIRGIPPKLKYFNACGCDSLTSACRSMLLRKELHEAGYTNFIVPIAEIPEWFERRSRGVPISFRVRKELPAIAICFRKASVEDYSLQEYEGTNENDYLYTLEDGLVYPIPKEDIYEVFEVVSFILIFNGKEYECFTFELEENVTYLFDLRKILKELPEDELNEIEEALLERQWVNVQIIYKNRGKRILMKSGIHVLNEQSRDDIHFIDDLNNSHTESENMEVAETKTVCWTCELELPKKCRFTSDQLTDFLREEKFKVLKSLNFDGCQFLTEIPDVSFLQQLEKLSFQWCPNLLTIHESVGSLANLKILKAGYCPKLKSFPCIKLTSLEQLKLVSCDGLESFPKISGKMENLKKLKLDGTSSCLDAAIFLKSISDDTVSSNIQRLSLRNCNLSDEFFPIALQCLANVNELDLSENNFTVIPESIKECRFLTKLTLESCRYLQEIKGVPPNLKHFSVTECPSLTFIVETGIHVLKQQISSQDDIIKRKLKQLLKKLKKCRLEDMEVADTTLTPVTTNEDVVTTNEDVVTTNSILVKTGIHVLKQQSSVEDIQFIYPQIKRKLESQNQQLLKKPRLVDMEVADTTLTLTLGLDYDSTLGVVTTNEDGVLGEIRKWKGPNRVRTLLTNLVKYMRDSTLDPSCYICGDDVESTDHVFRHCAIARAVWYLLLPAPKHTTFFTQERDQWMIDNLLDDQTVRGRRWSLIFAVALDVLRNYCRDLPETISSRILDEVDAIAEEIEHFEHMELSL